MNQTIVYDNLLIIIKQKEGLAAQERLYRLTKIPDFKLDLEYKFPQEYNNTLLICAAKYGLNDLAHELIMMGADVHAIGDQNFTALHCAARFGHVLIVDFLLRAKAGVNALTSMRDTPLHLAAYHGFANVMRLLIEWEADVNAQNKNGMTPLHFAARQGHEDAVKILIQQKQIDLTGGKKATASPLQIAEKNGHTDIENILTEAQSKINTDKRKLITLESKLNDLTKESKKRRAEQQNQFAIMKTLPHSTEGNKIDVSCVATESYSPELDTRKYRH